MQLFRYRPPQKYLENEIVNSEIRFSPIINMNDFYDGYFQYTDKGNLERHIEILKHEVLNHAKEILKNQEKKTQVQINLENHSQKNIVNWAYNIMNTKDYFEKSIEQLKFDFKNNPEKIKKTVNLQNQNAAVMRNNILICCLSKKKLCISMFGYYAKDGTGVMIEYEDTKSITKAVKYVDQLPLITIDKTMSEQIEMQVFTKLNSWKHEEEIRGYIYKKDENTNMIQTSHGLKIKGIYLGPRIKKEYSNLVKEWSESKSIQVYEPIRNKLGHLDWQ